LVGSERTEKASEIALNLASDSAWLLGFLSGLKERRGKGRGREERGEREKWERKRTMCRGGVKGD
jgi:hypothetical protein